MAVGNKAKSILLLVGSNKKHAVCFPKGTTLPRRFFRKMGIMLQTKTLGDIIMVRPVRYGV